MHCIIYICRLCGFGTVLHTWLELKGFELLEVNHKIVSICCQSYISSLLMKYLWPFLLGSKDECTKKQSKLEKVLNENSSNEEEELEEIVEPKKRKGTLL